MLKNQSKLLLLGSREPFVNENLLLSAKNQQVKLGELAIYNYTHFDCPQHLEYNVVEPYGQATVASQTRLPNHDRCYRITTVDAATVRGLHFCYQCLFTLVIFSEFLTTYRFETLNQLDLLL